VIGSPEGLPGTVSNGIISAFRENRSMIQITAPISPGSSGSPVMNESGEVIGVATMATKEGQNLGFAIPAEEVKHALLAPRDQPTTAPAFPNPQPWVGIETPSEPPQVDARTSVLAFVKDFWSHNASNDPGDWASDFAPQAAYCYSDGGLADRGFIRYDRAKLVKRYPVRHHKFFDPNIQMRSSGNSARVTFSYSYSYAGRRSAAGFCRVSLTVQNIAGKWLISDYDEKVDRQ
jgi:trypsin-like peptidase